MELKVKRLHPDAVIPHFATKGAAGLDLTCVSVERMIIEGEVKYRCHTGLAFEIPEGYVGLLFPRSSICKKPVRLTNSVGVLDSDFRGEVTAVFAETIESICLGSHPDRMYQAGDRCCQLVIQPIPEVNVIEVDELSETERGEGGYGSTGK